MALVSDNTASSHEKEMIKRSANLEAELKVQIMEANINIERAEEIRVLAEQEKVAALEESSTSDERLKKKRTTLTEDLDRRRFVVL